MVFILLALWQGMMMENVAAGARLAPDFTVSTAVREEKLEVKALPPQAHHFNVKAPMFLEGAGPQKIRPLVAKDNEVTFLFPCPALSKFQVTLYLCDDQNKYCEGHQVSVDWKGCPNSKTASLSKKTGSSIQAPSRPPADKTRDANGFITNRPAEAFALAKKENKPLLIDFYAIWCPPCNELEQRVFIDPIFKKAAARFVKLRMDVDTEVSWELKSKFKVAGYPTLVFATAEGDEIHRFSGFRPVDVFVQEMEKAWIARSQPLQLLKKRADAGEPEALAQAGALYLARGEYETALRYLSRTTAEREKLLMARIGVATGPAVEKALEEYVREFPETPESLEYRCQLAERRTGESRLRLLSDVVRIVQETSEKHPERLRGRDYTVADLWTLSADAYEKLGDKTKALESWRQAARNYETKLRSAEDRGGHLEWASALWRSGQDAKAEKIYSRFETKYPREFTFFFGHASMLLARKRIKEAVGLAEKAVRYSYGDNHLRAVHLLARVRSEEGKPAEALKLIKDALGRSGRLPEDKGIRTHRYLQALRDLEDELRRLLSS